MAANSTMAVPPTAPETSTTCTESSSVYLPGVPASSAVVPTPSTPAAVTSSAPVVPAVPASSGPAYPAVPASSSPAYPAVPESSKPVVPAVPASSVPVVPAVPASSTSCTEEEHKPTTEASKPSTSEPAYPAVPVSSGPAYPAVPASSKPVVPAVPASSMPVVPVVPASSIPVVPAVPASSTSCTEEEQKPTTEASKPSTSGPAYPAVPVSSAPAYPAVPVSSAPAYPAVPASSKPAVPAVPASSKPAVPAVPASSKPAYPAVPSVELPSFTPAVPTSSKPVAAKPTPSSSKPSGSKPTGGSYDNTGHIVTNGDKWSMTYTPYAENGDCKTADAVAADIKKIAELGFTTIRSYSTDCGVFEHVVPACQEHGIKIIYGIFLEAGGKAGKGPFSDYANEQLKTITDNAPKDSVAMVIVGNECMFNNNCQAEELGAYIDYVRNEFHSCGFPTDIAFTTAEPVGTWEEKGAALCSHIDVFCAQIHPFFTATVSASKAGEFVAQQLEQAAKVCPEAAARGKYVSETGWPSAGNPNGDAIPSVEDQKIAIKSIIEKVGSEVCLMGLVDDTWKAPGTFGVEQHWGCVEALEAM